MLQQPLRILHITASSMIGGGPEHVWQLLRHLPDNIVNYVAAPDVDPYGSRFVECVGADRFLAIPQRKFTLGAFFSLINFIKKNKIDIIHSHGKGAGIYARFATLLTSVKSVHTFHGIHLPQNTFACWLYVALERTLCGISKACISVSDGEYTKAKDLKLCPQGLTTIYNGVLIPEKLELRNMPKPLTLLHVSRFDTKQKNSLFLTEIALALREKKILEQCLFILVGDGEELPLLKNKIEAAKLNAYFQFEGQQKSVSPYYKDAACLISTSRWEGMPLAVLEAAAHGLPVIASDVVGNRDAVIDGKTGFLYPLDNAEKAADCIETLLKNEEQWQEMRKNAYDFACDNFSVQKMAEDTEQIYRSL